MLYHLGTDDERVLLYVDIIGFSNLVRQNDKYDVNDGKTHDLTLIFPNFYHTVANQFYSHNIQEEKRIKFLWASDTIVLSAKTADANTIVKELITLQNLFYCGGMAFRGCICVGNLFHQDNIWGEPLIRAAEIEKSNVIFPRVIISETDLNKIGLNQENINFFENDEKNPGFASFMPFRPNLKLILASHTAIIHSTLNVYTSMVYDNYILAPSDVKYRWVWMARKLLEEIEMDRAAICKKLEEEKEAGHKNCNLFEIVDKLNSITD
jgi:hypothetical protein